MCQSCLFTSNCPPHSAYLGRPWREYAKVVLLNCQMEHHICPEGWNDWGKESAHDTGVLCRIQKLRARGSPCSRGRTGVMCWINGKQNISPKNWYWVEMTAGTRNANFSKYQRAETHLVGFTCYYKNEPGTFINSSPGSFTIHYFEKLMLLMTLNRNVRWRSNHRIAPLLEPPRYIKYRAP